MKISFTGSQTGMTQFQKDHLARKLVELGCSEFIHGDCIGSDAIANEIALELGIKIFHIFPSIFPAKRAFCFQLDVNPSEYQDVEGIRVKIDRPDKPLERNKKIVNEGEVLLVTPKEFKHTLRSSTWATIRYAWKLKKKVLIIPPVKGEDEL